MKKYLKLDSRRLAYGEYWKIVRSWKVVIPWTAKLLNIRMKFTSGMPYFESVRELVVPEEKFSRPAQEKLEPMLSEFQRLGFHSPLYTEYQTMHRETSTSTISMMHPSGAIARLTYSVSLKAQPPKENTLCYIVSELGDGTFLVTSNRRQQFFTAPGIVVNRLVGADPEKVIEYHLRKLAELPLGNCPKRISSTDEAFDIYDRYEKRSRDHGFQRGIYVLMNDDETAVEHQHLADAKTMAAGKEEDVGVLIELNKLQNRKARWTGMAILFVISLVLFIGAGTRHWSMDYLVILVGVVFVHELGYYLAMRTFNYKNVRMFFIPFFGAAVSGRHYNVPGWKKAVVSLMGPVPGIYLALIVGGLGWYLHKSILFKIALVSLLLNGSNLVPILPLDGGWVFHSLLFSRHYMLDVVFRALAAAALLAVAVLLKSKSLIYVGILMLISLPVTFRMVRVAAALKQRGLPPVSDDDQIIPPATAQAIIAEVRKATKKRQSNKGIAQQTLQIFEMLNARPPGLSATVGLLFVQCASIAIAAVFAVVFILGRNWPLLSLARNFGKSPAHKLAVEQMQTWNPDHRTDSSSEARDTVIATFRDSAGAMAAFQDVTNRLPASSTLKLFGDSLLLSLPCGDVQSERQWLRDLSRRSKNAFMDTTNFHSAFSLSCTAPDTNVAAAIVGEMHDYFGTLPAEGIVPPWEPADPRTHEQRAANELARQTWLKLEKFESLIEDDTNFEALENQLENAQDNGDSNVGPLQFQIAGQRERLYRQHLPELLSGKGGTVDTNVVDRFMALNTSGAATNQNFNEKIQREIAQRMGKVGTDCFCAQSGAAISSGQTINMSFISFNRADDGPPALAEWLRDKGCDDFKYSFLPIFASTSDSN